MLADSPWLHIFLNHITLSGYVFSLFIFIMALILKDKRWEVISLVMVSLSAFSVIPAYYSGFEAEAIIIHLPHISKKAITPHQSMASILMWVLLLNGLTSFIMLLRPRLPRIKYFIFLTLAVAGVVLLFMTAHLGGMIRHPELL